jgi:RND family efflux transporter MFP subunit
LKKITMYTTRSKSIILFFVAILIISACKQEQALEDNLNKKEILTKKKLELKELKTSIEKLEAEIEKEEPPKVKKKTLVTLDTITLEAFDKYVDIQANVVSEDYVNASSEVGGRLINIYVKEGDYVKRGKLLASVDLESLEKQLAEIETTYSLAKTVYERQDRLWKQNIGSEIQLLEAKNNKERLEKSMETIKFQLNKKNIYAPISGYIDMEFAKAGEMTSPGMPIVSILNTRKVKIVADLPENYLGSVKKGDQVSVYFPALDKELNARITMLGRSIDPTNRTFKIEVNTDNKNGVLKPNLLAEVKINNYSKAEAIVLASDLVQEDVNGKQYVFLARQQDSHMVAEKVNVVLGESYENKIVIEEGLQVNDLVIIDGARSLSNGNLIALVK